jgi:ABC-type dipeptide/oligopeptide/nickel transport system permease subunit
VSASPTARPAGPPPRARRPSWRSRWARRSPGAAFWTGFGILGVYLAAALSALVVFRGSLNVLPVNRAWIPPFHPIGPSWAHPFGVLPGFGTGLFGAIWRATPWDLAIVASILTIDVVLGLLLGTIAGLYEGGVVDAVVTFVGDSLGSIPPVFWAVFVFTMLAVVAPNDDDLVVFVVIFGLILWPTTARTVRERARIVSHDTYVEAARASGAGSGRVLVRHVLPNSVGPVLAQVPLNVAPIFFTLSVIPWFWNCVDRPPPPPGTPPVLYIFPILPSFWPLPSPSFPEWGYLLGFGACEGFSIPGGFDYWWMYLFPLLTILVLGIAIALVCDGVERWQRFGR